MPDIFRVSFSILDPWSHGNFDEAVKRWMRIETPPTQQMEDGKLFHKVWQSETMGTKELPKVFQGAQLPKYGNHLPELKMECVIDDWIQFVGVIDDLEGPIIHEYKTGGADSKVYIRTMQTPCYQVLAEENGYKPTVAFVHHFNQYTKRVTRSKRYLSNQTSQMAREWIRTFASELHEALDGAGQL